MATAVGIGAVSVVIGLLVSYHHDTAAGATMAFTAVVIFLVALTATALENALRSRFAGASAE